MDGVKIFLEEELSSKKHEEQIEYVEKDLKESLGILNIYSKYIYENSI